MRDEQQVIQRAWELGAFRFLAKKRGATDLFTTFDGVLSEGDTAVTPYIFFVSNQSLRGLHLC
jgi:hypothetical protein